MNETDRLLNYMAEKGLRITEQRKTIASIFIKTKVPLAPKDLYFRMAGKYPGLSLDTVYRNIRSLVSIRVIEPVGFREGVRYRLRLNRPHHGHHLVCIGCEHTFPLNYCPMEKAEGIPPKFKIVRHTFEVMGYCEDCSAQQNE